MTALKEIYWAIWVPPQQGEEGFFVESGSGGPALFADGKIGLHFAKREAESFRKATGCDCRVVRAEVTVDLLPSPTWGDA